MINGFAQAYGYANSGIAEGYSIAKSVAYRYS